MLQAEMKRRRDDEKGNLLLYRQKQCSSTFLVSGKVVSHQNGELMESPHGREKHHHSRVTTQYN